MLITMNCIFIIIFMIPFCLSLNFRWQRKRIIGKIAKNTKLHFPYVTVIIPFIGKDYNISKTVEALLKQEYAGDYEIIFVTSDQSSPNINKIKKITENKKQALLVFAQKSVVYKNRGDKINSLLTGVQKANKLSEVYLFMDSDMVPAKNWIHQMVQTVQIEDCGIATGSNWIISENKTVFSSATRFWDFLATTMITFPFTNFARGSQMGISRKVFEQLEIEKVWSNAFHDNFTISTAVRKAKKRIYYSPFCLTEEHFDLKGLEWIVWIKRQAVHTKVHFKKLWAFGFFAVTLPRFIGGIGFLATAVTGVFYPLFFLKFMCFTLWPLLHFFGAFEIIQSVYPDAQLVSDYDNSLKNRLKFTLISYVTLLHCLGSIWAIFSNKIEWRKLVYQEKNDSETLYEGKSNEG